MGRGKEHDSVSPDFEESLVRLKNIEANIRAEGDEDALDTKVERTFPQRMRVLSERLEQSKHFVSREAFDQFLAQSPDSDQFKARIVSRTTGQAPRTGSASAAANALAIDAYFDAVKGNRIDPGRDLRDFPEDLPLCEYLALGRTHSKKIVADNDFAEAFKAGVNAKIASLNAKWQAITGDTFSLESDQLPRLHRLLEKKAPLPATTSWSVLQADREQERYAGSAGGPTSAAPLEADSSMEASSAADLEEVTPGDAAAPPDGDSDCPSCSVEDIMFKSGARPNPTPGTDRELTFPGPLKIDEQIFYDYGVVLPVEECGPLRVQINAPSHSLKALQAIGAQVLSINHSIDHINFRASFGFYYDGGNRRFVLDDINAIASEVIDLDDPSSSELHSLKRRLHECAAMLRATAARQLFMTKLGSSNPADHNIELSEALLEVEELGLQSRLSAIPEDIEEPISATIFVASADTPTLQFNDVNDEDTVRYAPNARHKSSGAFWWTDHWYGYNSKVIETEVLAPYLEQLGSEVLPRFQRLASASEAMRSAVASFVTGSDSSNVEQQYQDFFTNEVSLMAETLADLLEEIGSTLPRVIDKRGDGSMRLGLLMVYRQRWIPEGYVRGKIVGYKNLPPDSKESMTQRSFVKTLRETTRTEEFMLEREHESSTTRKETSELVQEMSGKFGFSANVGGGFDVGAVGNVTASVGTSSEVAGLSRVSRNRISESTARSAQSFNEKREVKVTDRLETEETLERAFSVKNLNKEITANYFYYQLLREYIVTLELQDMRPVLLRKKMAPSEVAIDHHFVSNYLHLLVAHLPESLARDAATSVDQIDGLARRVTRYRRAARKREVLFEHYRSTPRPENTEDDPSAGADYDARLAAFESAMNEAIERSVEGEELYREVKSKSDRVVNHVREHRTHYAQYIWGNSPKEDENIVLNQEQFGTYPLSEVTNGLVREGFIGDEEIFEYGGPSITIVELLLDHMIAGSDIVNSMSEEELRETNLFRQIARFYGDDEVDNLVERIRSQWFVSDPLVQDEVLSSRRVQVAQDAAVVEAMPGTVPLLEGYQLAQRYLAVEQSCLENKHLEGRIKDKTWTSGEDTLRVYRREGTGATVPEEQ